MTWRPRGRGHMNCPDGKAAVEVGRMVESDVGGARGGGMEKP
jgi:hypothetical protein